MHRDIWVTSTTQVMRLLYCTLYNVRNCIYHKVPCFLIQKQALCMIFNVIQIMHFFLSFKTPFMWSLLKCLLIYCLGSSCMIQCILIVFIPTHPLKSSSKSCSHLTIYVWWRGIIYVMGQATFCRPKCWAGPKLEWREEFLWLCDGYWCGLVDALLSHSFNISINTEWTL